MSGKKRRRNKPLRRKEPYSAAMGTVAGITILAGGVEPAGAATLNENVNFNCSVSQSVQVSDTSGTFSAVNSNCMGTAPKFDTLGGTLSLDSVTLSVDGSSESFVSATFNGNPAEGGIGTTNATGVYSFTVDALSLDASPGPGTTVTETAQVSCDVSSTCPQTNPESISPFFETTFTDTGTLAGFQMDGGGTYNFVPLIALSGDWSCDGCSEVLSETGISSEFNGWLTITYEYSMVVIPVPAALPLLGSGLAMLGWYARRRKPRSD